MKFAKNRTIGPPIVRLLDESYYYILTFQKFYCNIIVLIEVHCIISSLAHGAYAKGEAERKGWVPKGADGKRLAWQREIRFPLLSQNCGALSFYYTLAGTPAKPLA